MKYLFYFGHPAHYHLFKNIIRELIKRNHNIKVVIKTKDILEELCVDSGIEYQNVLPEGRKDNKLSIAISFAKKYYRISKILAKIFKPDLLIGSEPTLPHLGKIFNIPSIIFSEDDAKIIPQFARIAYPFVSTILSPYSCDAGKWEYRKIGYNGFHKLAYLHPSVFKPDRSKINNLAKENYIILRFAELTAYHDNNRNGIDREIARELINILKTFGKVYITSEKKLGPELERYRLKIDPLNIHHALYFAKMYIGDSQSMAVEAALLGTPGIRFNDFADEIGVLFELEHLYGLTTSVKSSDPDKLIDTVNKLLITSNLQEKYQERRTKMLNEKIDVLKFFVWFIDNYPESAKTMKKNPDYQWKFK